MVIGVNNLNNISAFESVEAQPVVNSCIPPYFGEKLLQYYEEQTEKALKAADGQRDLYKRTDLIPFTPYYIALVTISSLEREALSNAKLAAKQKISNENAEHMDTTNTFPSTSKEWVSYFEKQAADFALLAQQQKESIASLNDQAGNIIPLIPVYMLEKALAWYEEQSKMYTRLADLEKAAQNESVKVSVAAITKKSI